MVEAINHDPLSAAGTVAGKAAWGGLIGAALPALASLAIGAVGLLALGAVPGMFAAGTWIGGAVTTLFGLAATAGGGFGLVASLWSAPVLAGTSAAAGGIVGALGGASQVGREHAEFRRRVAEHGHGARHGKAKLASQHHNNGLQEGYHLGDHDGFIRGAQVGFAQGQQDGFQKGMGYFRAQLEHMAAAQEQQQQQKRDAAPGMAKPAGFEAPGKTKPGGVVETMGLSAKCECTAVERLAMQEKERAEAAKAPRSIGKP